MEIILNRLMFYNNIRNDEIIKRGVRVSNLCSLIAEPLHEGSAFSREDLLDDYYELQRELIDAVPVGEMAGSYWENYVCELVAESENVFSLAAERQALTDNVQLIAEGDADIIRQLIGIDWSHVAGVINDGRPCVCSMQPPVDDDGRSFVLRTVLSSEDPAQIMGGLARYYARNLCGLLGKYHTFIWDGALKGVKNTDPITFDELVGYETQKAQLIKNTEIFLSGRRANNVLLYGDKGTGKSSSIKALLNHYSEDGLRLINLPKDHIFDIGHIMDMVADRGCRFIIFIDDLSFEDSETEYKHFKSVLEGGAELQPKNVIICVTSNRRNLVKETWKDRNDSEGEIHVMDGVHERQSLADRFGLTITFSAPDKDLYNEIVMSIARREGVDMEEGALLVEANKWDMRQTSRSGRSAKQFIANLAGLK